MVVGFDMEWKPVRGRGAVEKPSVLQLGIDKHVCIIDLLSVYNNKLCIIIFNK